MKQVTLHKGSLRFIEDLEDAYDRDPDGMADMFGYNSERLHEHISELKSAISKS